MMKHPVIGLAYAPTIPPVKYERYSDIIRRAGGIPVVLEQVRHCLIRYLPDGSVAEEDVQCPGMLRQEAADWVKTCNFDLTNVRAVLNGIDGVFFPGGQDVTPSLLKRVMPVLNAGEAIEIARDVSDYILMTYCIQYDIPLLAVCHGEQILGVAEGCELVQNMADDFSADVCTAHRMPEKAGRRDYARGDIHIIDPNSLTAAAAGGDLIENAALWHHQCLRSVEGTKLKVTAVTRTNGIEIIQAIERPDKRFCLGLQFHPEIDCGADLDDSPKVRCNEDTCMNFFRCLVRAAE